MTVAEEEKPATQVWFTRTVWWFVFKVLRATVIFCSDLQCCESTEVMKSDLAPWRRLSLHRIRVIATWVNASYSYPASGIICLCTFMHIFSCLQESEGESHLLPNEINFTRYNTSILKNHYYSYMRCNQCSISQLVWLGSISERSPFTTQTSISLVGCLTFPADLLQVLKSNLTSLCFIHNNLTYYSFKPKWFPHSREAGFSFSPRIFLGAWKLFFPFSEYK